MQRYPSIKLNPVILFSFFFQALSPLLSASSSFLPLSLTHPFVHEHTCEYIVKRTDLWRFCQVSQSVVRQASVSLLYILDVGLWFVCLNVDALNILCDIFISGRGQGKAKFLRTFLAFTMQGIVQLLHLNSLLYSALRLNNDQRANEGKRRF